MAEPPRPPDRAIFDDFTKDRRTVCKVMDFSPGSPTPSWGAGQSGAAAAAGHISLFVEGLARADRVTLEDMMHVIRRGDAPMIDWLLQHGMDPNAVPLRPPHLGAAAAPLLVGAAISRHFELIPLIVQRGGDVDRADHRGVCPLLAAVAQGQVGCALALLRAGASVRGNPMMISPLEFAEQREHLVLSRALRLFTDDPAAGMAYLQEVLPFQRLLQASKSDDGEEEVLDLLAQGVDPCDERCWDRLRNSPLHWAAHFGRVPVVAALLKHGASAEARTIDLWTPLHDACAAGRRRCALLLVEAGADVTARTAQHPRGRPEAADMSPADMAREHMADADVHDPDLADALELVATEHAEGLARLRVLAHGEGLREAAKVGDVSIIRRLLRDGFDPNSPSSGDGLRNSALHWAACFGHVGALRALIAGGADLNATTVDGWTPLHDACSRGRRQCAYWLLKAGADPNLLTVEHPVGQPEYRRCSASDMARRSGHDDALAEAVATWGRNALDGAEKFRKLWAGKKTN